MPDNDDLFAARNKPADDDTPLREISEGPTIASEEVAGQNLDGVVAFDAEASHRPAARRGELNQQQGGHQSRLQ